MSYAEVSRFVQDLRHNPILIQQLSSSENGLESLVSEANEQGYAFTSEEASEFARAQKAARASDLCLETESIEREDSPHPLIQIVSHPVVIDPLNPYILIRP